MGLRFAAVRKPPLRLLGPALRDLNERCDLLGLRIEALMPLRAERPWLGERMEDLRLATRVEPLERTMLRVRVMYDLWLTRP